MQGFPCENKRSARAATPAARILGFGGEFKGSACWARARRRILGFPNENSCSACEASAPARILGEIAACTVLGYGARPVLALPVPVLRISATGSAIWPGIQIMRK
jgi:hypothetical protein